MFKLLIKYILTCTIVFYIHGPVFANTSYNEVYTKRFIQNIYLLKDQTNQLSINDIITEKYTKFKKINRDKKLFFNHEIYNYWLKVEVKNTSINNDHFVIYPDGFIDEVQYHVFTSTGKKVSSDISGPNFIKKNNALKFGRYGVSIIIPKGESRFIYTMIRPYYIADININMYRRKNIRRTHFLYLYFGGSFLDLF